MGKAQKAEVVMPAGRLWPNTPWGSPMEIEVFGATGEFASGKTIIGLSIAPGVHPEGHPFAGKPRTLYLDLEKSGATYGGTGCQRIDVPAELAKLHGANYTAKQVAEWFNALPGHLKPGQFDVVMVDPVNDIESGEVDVVRANPAAHGYTANQFGSSVGLLMAAMKAQWKKLLMGYANVCKCFFFTTHLRDEFKGGRPSGKREPRGKETLAELASLYLWMERTPDDKGVVSDRPSAIVVKHRLAATRIDAAGELETLDLMPARIPVATIQAIRQYIANPPDQSKPANGERVIEKPVTEIELQRMRLATAEAQTAAAQAQAAVIEKQRELATVRQAAQQPISQADKDALAAKLAAQEAEGRRLMEQNQKPDPTGTAQAAKTQTSTTTTTAPSNLANEFLRLLGDSGVSMEKIKEVLAHSGVERFTQATPQRQTEILEWLNEIARCQFLIKSLCLDEAKIAQLCKQGNVAAITDLTGPMAKALAEVLQKALNNRPDGAYHKAP